MSTLAPILITWLQQYSYPALWLCVFIASMGIPLPISVVFLAAGAFTALGDFNLVLLVLIGVSASVSGDTTGYLIGRKWGSRIFLWLEEKKRLPFISPQSIAKSRSYFIKRGGLAIFLTRFLFSGLGGSINLLAGAELYPYPRFLVYDLSGEVLGAFIPLSLGYIFGASWEAVGDILSAISLVILAILGTIYFSWRLVRQIRRAKDAESKAQEEKSVKEISEERGKRVEEEGKTATFIASQTYIEETDTYLQASLDSLAGNYTKKGPEGLE